MQNPFTTTFSKTPESYIETNEIYEIIDNFRYETPSESVFKITGVRGSGKTVLLAKTLEEINSFPNYITCTLSSSRDLLIQLLAFFYSKGFINSKTKKKNLKIAASIHQIGGSLDLSKEKFEDVKDVGIEIEKGLKYLKSKNIKLFIAIDEVSKNNYMIEFASEFGKWLISNYNVYLVCTGLYENIVQLSNVSNLTFFRRATTIKTAPLNLIKMTEMYKIKLKVTHDIAYSLGLITKGYAYAFQELGVLYFKNKDKWSNDEIISSLKGELFSYSYEKIWEELSEGDRTFLKIMSKKELCDRDFIVKNLNKKENYSVYRDRLLKRGLIIYNSKGFLSLALPFFDTYIKEYVS